MIDFYAIKADECKWFTELYNYWEKSKNLAQLPNFAYSVALAYHNLSLKKPESSKASGDKASSSCASMPSSEELCKQANKHLQYAILMFPSVILPLLDKCGVQVDSRTRNHSFFNAQAQNR